MRPSPFSSCSSACSCAGEAVGGPPCGHRDDAVRRPHPDRKAHPGRRPEARSATAEPLQRRLVLAVSRSRQPVFERERTLPATTLLMSAGTLWLLPVGLPGLVHLRAAEIAPATWGSRRSSFWARPSGVRPQHLRPEAARVLAGGVLRLPPARAGGGAVHRARPGAADAAPLRLRRDRLPRDFHRPAGAPPRAEGGRRRRRPGLQKPRNFG